MADRRTFYRFVREKVTGKREKHNCSCKYCNIKKLKSGSMIGDIYVCSMYESVESYCHVTATRNMLSVCLAFRLHAEPT